MPKTHDAMIDVLIAIRYMCMKRMIYPVVAATIERRNEYLVMSKACLQMKPTKVYDAIQDPNCAVNSRWLLRAFTRTALHFDLLPVIVDRSGEFQPLITRYFDKDDADFAYRRQYDIRYLTQLTEIRKPRMYLLNGVNYGVQITRQETEKVESRERSRYSE
ncbi:hypothetical protein pEaSNUABM40_00237 [Erwinia phage pEa_SNUABM_40]|uniref:Uncharacterized protein n=1 Tax=Erwinia phage pEa_SNUABM_3 TaxID=2869552 RepID=A0AAE7XJ80_9CAUD|nr:hypothetical protein MPK68_gp234 [Erwinia phage pEa_SNUABM_3]QZE56431.1 hypothetical protein pEaSNUABM3_00234 [Erwinia phage pEa_SNUABM_3]QZE56769.1 hypothetical protein pEaSNUABM20_00233 [Erwinia phage pEa_SNUABM_20]QZE58453.1 hypothetical protein pEaSNUABM40_00237 [Erwinia phage pEa_SNUABM_40]